MKTLIVTCILLAILAARAYWQLEDAQAENTELRAQVADAMFEIERLEGRYHGCLDTKRMLRAGVIE